MFVYICTRDVIIILCGRCVRIFLKNLTDGVKVEKVYFYLTETELEATTTQLYLGSFDYFILHLLFFSTYSTRQNSRCRILKPTVTEKFLSLVEYILSAIQSEFYVYQAQIFIKEIKAFSLPSSSDAFFRFIHLIYLYVKNVFVIFVVKTFPF